MDDVPGTPLDVALWPLHDFPFELQELGHFIPRGCWMHGEPSIPVLFVTVRAGARWLAGSIYLRMSPAWTACSLGQPHPGFVHFMAPAAFTLTMPAAFGVLSTLALPMTLAACPTICPALATCLVQLLLSICAVPDPQTSPVVVFKPFT